VPGSDNSARSHHHSGSGLDVGFSVADLATFGMGLAITPLAFAATTGVASTRTGLASGVLNTSRQVGASIALAALATLAADRTQSFRATPSPPPRTRPPP
jgi:hypothetical protein